MFRRMKEEITLGRPLVNIFMDALFGYVCLISASLRFFWNTVSHYLLTVDQPCFLTS